MALLKLQEIPNLLFISRLNNLISIQGLITYHPLSTTILSLGRLDATTLIFCSALIFHMVLAFAHAGC